MVPDPAPSAALSAVQTVPTDEGTSAERWRQWQLKNAETYRTDAKRMRVVFTAVFAAVGLWLGIQLLAPALLP